MAGLTTVGTDILNGRCPHLTWYQREVFGTLPTILYTQGHDIVPNLTTTNAQQKVIGIISLNNISYFILNSGIFRNRFLSNSLICRQRI